MADNKPKFDPNKPFEAAKPKFDPSQAFDTEDPLMVGKPISKTESFTRGGLQGATLGFADELAGAGEAGIDALKGNVEPSFEELVKAYQKHRDESRANFKAAEDANPYTYMGGQMVGGIAPVALAGPAGASVGGAARIGALTGLGTSGVDLAGDGSVADKLEGAGKDVVLGGVLGAGAASIPAAASFIKNKTLPGKLLTQELSGNRIVGADARRKLGDELVSTSGQIAEDVQNAMNDAAQNKTSILDELTKSGKKYDIADIQQALGEGEKKLPTSFTKEGDSARKALKEPFERAAELGQVPPSEGVPAEELMQTQLDPKQLDSFRRALGRLGYEKDLKDDQVIALAKRLSGKASEKLNTDVNPETGEMVKNALGKTNDKIKNLIEAQDIFNLGGKAADELGQEKALTPLLQRLEADTTSADIARSQVKKGFDALRQAEPELAKNAEEKATDIADRYIMGREANRPLTISREGAKRAAMVGAGYTGRALHSLDQSVGGLGTDVFKNLIKPVGSVVADQAGSFPTQLTAQDISNAPNVSKMKFSDLKPDQMMQIAARLKGKGVDAVAKKVETAAQSNDPVQKAQAEFVLKQTPSARRHVENPNEDDQN